MEITDEGTDLYRKKKKEKLPRTETETMVNRSWIFRAKQRNRWPQHFQILFSNIIFKYDFKIYLLLLKSFYISKNRMKGKFKDEDDNQNDSIKSCQNNPQDEMPTLFYIILESKLLGI